MVRRVELTRTRVVFGVGCALATVLLLGSLVVSFGPRSVGTNITGDALKVVAGFLAGASCAYAVWRGRVRSAVVGVAAAMCLLYTSGDFLWLVFADAAPTSLVLTVADLCYLIALLPAVAGLLTYPTARGLGRAWLPLALDGLVLGSAALLVSDVLALAEVADGTSHFDTFVYVVFPVTSVLLASLVLLLLVRSVGSVRPDVALLGLTFATYAVADLGYALSTVRQEDHLGTFHEFAYVAAPLLLAMAALTAATFDTNTRVLQRHLSGPLAQLLPGLRGLEQTPVGHRSGGRFGRPGRSRRRRGTGTYLSAVRTSRRFPLTRSTTPFLDADERAEQPDPHRDALVGALAAAAPPYGEVVGAVGYHYEQWAQVASFAQGIGVRTRDNPDFTMLDDTTLEPRWSVAVETKRSAYDASAERYAVATMPTTAAPETVMLDADNGERVWCHTVGESAVGGDDTVATQFLANESLVVSGRGPAHPAGRRQRRGGVGPRGRGRRRRLPREASARVLLVHGGSPLFRLLDPDDLSERDGGTALAAIDEETGEVRWTRKTASGDGPARGRNRPCGRPRTGGRTAQRRGLRPAVRAGPYGCGSVVGESGERERVRRGRAGRAGAGARGHPLVGVRRRPTGSGSGSGPSRTGRSSCPTGSSSRACRCSTPTTP